MMDLLSFPENSRVWIYSADQELVDDIASIIHQRILNFAKEWSSHQMALKATGGFLHNYFIVFIVDDGFNKPGGCSIDTSVRFVKELGNEFEVDFFNRSIFYYLQNERTERIHQSEINQAIESHLINNDTLFFDTLVQTKNDFVNSWLKPLGQSWHSRLIYQK